MPNQFVLTIPNDSPELRDEIETAVAQHAQVYEQPPVAFDLETTKLIVEIVGGSIGAAAATFQTVKTLLDIRAMLKKSGRPSGVLVGAPGTRGTPLEDADEALLRRMLGAQPGSSDQD